MSKYRVRRWTRCQSTSTWECISTTGWTGLIKHIVQEVAGYCSLKPSLQSAVRNTLFFVVMGKGGNKDAVRISTKLQKKSFCCLNLRDRDKRRTKISTSVSFPTPSLVILGICFNTPRCSMKVSPCSFVPPTD